jgi:hypothetical protein
MKARYGCDERDLTHYTCYRTSRRMRIDGRLDKPAWRDAPGSPRFVDLVSGVPGLLDTRMASLWDDEALYVAFWVSEPNVQARLARRDSLVWTENDVEIFIGGEDCYYEFEINARGTVYEVFYVWQDALKKGSRFDRPEFDLRERRVDVLGGFQDAMRWGRHPRGLRWAFMGPFETIELNAPGGIADYCSRYTPWFRRYVADLPTPSVWDDAAWQRAAAAWGPEPGAGSIADKSRWRDRRLAALRAHKRAQKPYTSN